MLTQSNNDRLRRSFPPKIHYPSTVSAAPTGIRNGRRYPANRSIVDPMGDLYGLIWWAIVGYFGRGDIAIQILVLRHQLNVVRRCY
jgi:hypothetical protein